MDTEEMESLFTSRYSGSIPIEELLKLVGFGTVIHKTSTTEGKEMAKHLESEHVGIVASNVLADIVRKRKGFIIIAPTNGYPLDDSEDLGEDGIYDYEFMSIDPKRLAVKYGTCRVKQSEIPTLYELSKESCKTFMEYQKHNLPSEVQEAMWG